MVKLLSEQDRVGKSDAFFLAFRLLTIELCWLLVPPSHLEIRGDALGYSYAVKAGAL